MICSRRSAPLMRAAIVSLGGVGADVPSLRDHAESESGRTAARDGTMSAMDMKQLLEAAVAAGASDLHVRAGMPPMLRVNGDVQPLAAWTEGPVSPETATTLIASLFDDRRR